MHNETPRVFGFGLHFTLLMAFDGLRSIVSRFGEDHGNVGACVYAREDGKGVLTPVCIVGQFFHDLGILRALILAQGQEGLFGVESSSTDSSGVMCNLTGLADKDVTSYLAEQFGITFDAEALYFLVEAQKSQDQGEAWSVAVEEASEKTMNRFNLRPIDPRTQAERLHDCLNV